MKTRKILALLLVILLSSISAGSTFADDDGDDDRGERQERSHDRDDDDREEKDHDDKKDKEKRHNEDDERGERDGRDNEKEEHNRSDSIDQRNDLQENTVQRTKKIQSLKMAFAKRLGTRLDDFSQTKLETIVVVIDTKVLELDANTTMSSEKKERLTIAYLAIKGLINDKIEELSTENILDGLLK